jgi:23S rRNA (uracil1939-C5)-methyltransferase
MPPLAYRTTAELHGDRGRLGYYRPGSRRVADLPACCLHHPAINQALGSLRAEELWLRSATIRCEPATGRTLAVLDGKKRHELAERWMEAEPTLIGVTDKDGVSLVGQMALDQVVAGLQFRVSATSFFQINFLQWEPLVARVRELIEPTPKTRLLDLYCGVGLFALTLAREVDHVVGVEAYITAVKDARHNAQRNGIDNVHFRDASAEVVLPAYHGDVDRVVLDPPRRGCGPAVLDALAELRPKRIVYVSCHPGTLARDCKHLTQHGYHVRSAEIIDMFPHTSHVESIVALDRNMQT